MATVANIVILSCLFLALAVHGDPLHQPSPSSSSSFLDATVPFTIVGHRGSCGLYPEHTELSYRKAIEEGADFIECDICLTKDLHLICRHEPLLHDTTDVASRPEFADRKTTRLVDGHRITGFFSVDFTLAEIKTLRAVQRLPFRNQSFNGLYPIPTLDEYLGIVLSADRVVGAYPEIKHPDFFNEFIGPAGPRIEDLVLEAFAARGYSLAAAIDSAEWQARPVILQSFETRALEYMRAKAALPLMLLLPAVNATNPDAARALNTTEGLRHVRTFADIIGPDKIMLLRYSAEDGSRTSSGLLERATAEGLRVHIYTLRDEAQYLSYANFTSPQQELAYYMDLGVTGGFTDFPATVYAQVKDLRDAARDDHLLFGVEQLFIGQAQAPDR